VLDNLEAVLEPGESEARYRDGYAGYGVLLERLGTSQHQACLMLTSREEPPEVCALEGERGPVHQLELSGLSADESRILLRDKHLMGDSLAWAALVDQYRGNGLALKVVGETIRQVFGGDIADFLQHGEPVFGGIRRLLDRQVARLSHMERLVLTWLAVEREPVSVMDLIADLGPEVRRGATVEAVEALRRRSLLEQGERGTFTLQPVVLEYATERLVAEVGQEIADQEPAALLSYALVKATAQDYMRRSQERLLARPLLQHLIADRGGQLEAERHLTNLIGILRSRPKETHGYGPGKLANPLRLLRGNLNGVDLSGLEVRQLYLQEVEMQDARLAGAHLIDAILADAFDCSMAVALSADGAYLAAATTDGEVRHMHLPFYADCTFLYLSPPRRRDSSGTKNS